MVRPPNKTKPKPPKNPTHNKWLYLGTDFLRRAEEDRRRALIYMTLKGHILSMNVIDSLHTYYVCVSSC